MVLYRERAGAPKSPLIPAKAGIQCDWPGRARAIRIALRNVSAQPLYVLDPRLRGDERKGKGSFAGMTIEARSES
jgi:hypothetical protein